MNYKYKNQVFFYPQLECKKKISSWGDYHLYKAFRRIVVLVDFFLIKHLSIKKIDLHLHTQITKGRLAQLVQSTCLTSRGSAVRIRHRPQIKSHQIIDGFFYFWRKPELDVFNVFCCKIAIRLQQASCLKMNQIVRYVVHLFY
jgi:hypothetical protein